MERLDFLMFLSDLHRTLLKCPNEPKFCLFYVSQKKFRRKIYSDPPFRHNLYNSNLLTPPKNSNFSRLSKIVIVLKLILMIFIFNFRRGNRKSGKHGEFWTRYLFNCILEIISNSTSEIVRFYQMLLHNQGEFWSQSHTFRNFS